ncbi:hypothetical protein RI367_000726 [Sorochytrium milnesiophthora]
MELQSELLDEFQAKFSTAPVTPLQSLNRRLLDWSSRNLLALALPQAPLQDASNETLIKLGVLHPAVARQEFQHAYDRPPIGVTGSAHCLIPHSAARAATATTAAAATFPTAATPPIAQDIAQTMQLGSDGSADIDFVRFTDRGDAFASVDSAGMLMVWKADLAMNVWNPVYRHQLSAAVLCLEWFGTAAQKSRHRQSGCGPVNLLSAFTFTCFTVDGSLYTFWQDGTTFTHRAIAIPLVIPDATRFASADLFPASDCSWTLVTTLMSSLSGSCHVGTYKVDINTLSDQALLVTVRMPIQLLDSPEPPLAKCVRVEREGHAGIVVLAHDAQGAMLSVWRLAADDIWALTNTVRLAKIAHSFFVFSHDTGAHLVLGLADGEVQVYDSGLALLYHAQSDELLPVMSCALSPNKLCLITLHSNQAMRQHYLPRAQDSSLAAELAQQAMSALQRQSDFSDILNTVGRAAADMPPEEYTDFWQATVHGLIRDLYEAYAKTVPGDASGLLWSAPTSGHPFLRRILELSMSMYSQSATTEVNYRLIWIIINLTTIESIFMASMNDVELGEGAIARLIDKPSESQSSEGKNAADADTMPSFKKNSIFSLASLCSWVRDLCSHLTRQCYLAFNMQIHTAPSADATDMDVDKGDGNEPSNEDLTKETMTGRASIVSLLFHPTAVRTLRRLLALTVLFSRYLEDLHRLEDKPDAALLSAQQQLLVLIGRTKVKLDILSHWLSKIADFIRPDELAILVQARMPSDKRFASFSHLFHNGITYMVSSHQLLLNDAIWLDIVAPTVMQPFLVAMPIEHLRYWYPLESASSRVLTDARRSIDVIKKWKLGRASAILQCVRCYRFCAPTAKAALATAPESAADTGEIAELPSSSLNAPWYQAFARNCICGGQWWQLSEKIAPQFPSYLDAMGAQAIDTAL